MAHLLSGRAAGNTRERRAHHGLTCLRWSRPSRSPNASGRPGAKPRTDGRAVRPERGMATPRTVTSVSLDACCVVRFEIFRRSSDARTKGASQTSPLRRYTYPLLQRQETRSMPLESRLCSMVANDLYLFGGPL